MKKSQFELIVHRRLVDHMPEGLVLTPHYKFAKPRRFEFDFAFISYKLAIECEGGTWIGGRHTRGAGYQSDCQKYNLAVLAGWRVLRYTPQMIDQIIPDLQRIFNG